MRCPSWVCAQRSRLLADFSSPVPSFRSNKDVA
jgi:hypothetical protein